MTDCPDGDVRDQLPEYVAGTLGAARRAEIEAHLAGCADCREELALLRDLRATMRRGPRVDVDAIAAAIPPYRAPARRGWATSWRAAAAIAAIAIGGASIALLRDGGGTGTTRQVAEAPMVATPAPTPSRDVVPPRPTPAESAPSEVASAPAPPVHVESRELAMASGSIGELSDGELSALVEGLESLDALPSAEVEGGEVATASVREESR